MHIHSREGDWKKPLGRHVPVIRQANITFTYYSTVSFIGHLILPKTHQKLVSSIAIRCFTRYMFNSFFSLSPYHNVLYQNCFFGHIAYLSQLLLHPWQPRCDVTGNMAKSGCDSLIYSRPIMYGRWGEYPSRKKVHWEAKKEMGGRR